METQTRTGGRPVIWAITDGHAGNARQAVALAKAIAARRDGTVVEHRIALKSPWHLLPAWGWALGGARAGGWPFSGLAAGADALVPPWPALAIGAGRRSAPVVAAIRRLSGCRAVQVLRPGMALSAFDTVVVPRHDRLRGSNVLQTLGALNDLDPALVAAEAAAWARRLGHLPEPRVAVLVGGPGASADFGARALQGLTDGLLRLAVDGAGLMVTPSRRTPKAVIDRLADLVGGVGGWVWSGKGDNPYPGLLGLADAVVVTADSVNMASEAASTGKPVFVAAVDRLAPKLRAFHTALHDYGATRPFTGEMTSWRYDPLHETERVADAIASLLAPA